MERFVRLLKIGVGIRIKKVMAISLATTMKYSSHIISFDTTDTTTEKLPEVHSELKEIKDIRELSNILKEIEQIVASTNETHK